MHERYTAQVRMRYAPPLWCSDGSTMKLGRVRFRIGRRPLPGFTRYKSRTMRCTQAFMSVLSSSLTISPNHPYTQQATDLAERYIRLLALRWPSATKHAIRSPSIPIQPTLACSSCSNHPRRLVGNLKLVMSACGSQGRARHTRAPSMVRSASDPATRISPSVPECIRRVL